MVRPIQSEPVKRPHFVDPASCVALDPLPPEKADQLDPTRADLTFGANYNDPAQFQYQGYRQVMRSSNGRRRR